MGSSTANIAEPVGESSGCNLDRSRPPGARVRQLAWPSSLIPLMAFCGSKMFCTGHRADHGGVD